MISPDHRERLRQLWLRDAGPATAAQSAFDRLSAAYSEPDRHYHTLEHLAEMFDLLDRLGVDSPAVRLAVWYHDSVYDTHAPDNEPRSAELAVRELTALGLPAAVVGEVREIVLASDHRDRPEPPDGDTSAFLDADLAVLGASEERYARYAGDVRREYDWVPEAVYRARRAEVLRHFLKRPSIYRTEAVKQEREAAARRNLAAEVAELSRES